MRTNKSTNEQSPGLSTAILETQTSSRRNQAMRMIIGGTVVIAGLCAYYSYQTIRSFTLEQVKQSALLEVQQGVNDIDKWLAILRERVETLAHTPIVGTMQWSTVEPYLQRNLLAKRIFLNML